MKISDVVSREVNYDYVSLFTTFNGVNQELRVVRLGEERRQREPMTYDSKQYQQVGVLPLLVPKPYTATVRVSRGGQVVRRSITTYKHPNANWNEWNVGDFSEQREAYASDVLIPDWVWQVQNQLKVQANVEYLNKVQQRKVSILEEAKNFNESLRTISTSVERLALSARRMFKDPYKYVATALKKEKRRTGKGRRVSHNMLKTYGDCWLEGRYHWLPTYMTMRDAFIGLADLLPLMRAFHKTENSVSFTTVSYSNILQQDIEEYWTAYFEEKRGGWFTADCEGQAALRRYGLGSLPDLAAVAWELTPWSLVVDWVMPISDVLLAYNAINGLESHLPWQTSKMKIFSDGVSVQPRFDVIERNNITTRTRQETRVLAPERWEWESYSRTVKPVSELTIRPFIANQPIKLLRAIDALSFLSGSPWAKKVIRGKT